jgi:hypothetical protein
MDLKVLKEKEDQKDLMDFQDVMAHLASLVYQVERDKLVKLA